MKLLFVSLATALCATQAGAIEVLIGKPDATVAHRCEVQSIEVETRYNNQQNRVVLNLREMRKADYHSCPASVAVMVDSRAEALQMYEVIAKSTEATCLISDVVTGKHNKKTCDAGFNAKVKM